jgi:FlaA1/EpsC-like NDP-sugar epimerase
MDDLLATIKAISVSSLLIILSLYLLNQFSGYPRSVFFIDWLLLIVLIGGFRFSIRLLKELKYFTNREGKRVLIVGAGEAGESILREMLRNKILAYNPIGLIDDNPEKIGLKIHGVKVLGDKTKIPTLVEQHRIEEIIISIPSATRSQLGSIIQQCLKTNIKFKTLPSLMEMIDGQVSINQIREINVEDLLGREPVKIDLNSIKEEISEKVVLVTGAGGSIGAELCRQISKLSPACLLLFEHSENSLFYLDKELKEVSPTVRSVPLLADVTNRGQTKRILKQYQPDIIFHAAAHKHVPLNELDPIEVIRNNVIGTKYIADAAIETRAEKFVLISTDKAVKPINFMGTSKKICEQYISGISQNTSVKYLGVRFGNVIASNGSVIQIFREQINKRKPITITDPRMTRYFMTIPEAVQLVLQAANLGKGGEIFILDMGKPINIYELAKTLISLLGLEPEKDVKFVFTGLRSGEKLFEELYDRKIEKLIPTRHEKILLIERNDHFHFNGWAKHIEELEQIMNDFDEGQIREKIAEIISSFTIDQHPTHNFIPEQIEADSARDAMVLA